MSIHIYHYVMEHYNKATITLVDKDLTFMHFNSEGEIDTFSRNPCECCKSRLYGVRYDLDVVYSD